MRWLDSDSLFARSNDTMTTKRTLFDLACNNVIGLIYKSFQEYKSMKKRQKLCFSRSKKCEICVCAKIRTMRLASLLPSFLSLLAASSQRPPLTRTWPNCQSNRRGEKKIFVSPVLLPHSAYFLTFDCERGAYDEPPARQLRSPPCLLCVKRMDGRWIPGSPGGPVLPSRPSSPTSPLSPWSPRWRGKWMKNIDLNFTFSTLNRLEDHQPQLVGRLLFFWKVMGFIWIYLSLNWLATLQFGTFKTINYPTH